VSHFVSVETTSKANPRRGRARTKSKRPASAGSVMIGSMCAEAADSMTTTGFQARKSCASSPSEASGAASARATGAASHTTPNAAAAAVVFQAITDPTGLVGATNAATADSAVYTGP